MEVWNCERSIMGITNIWPLFLVVFIPGIILLYLLKTQAVPRKVPALNLWKEAYENMQAQTPWEKFRHHLLMYLQILALLLLILALTMPYLRLRGGDSARVVICMDLSGSMNGSYDEKRTKFEEEVRQAKKYVSQLKQGTKVTLLTADRSGKMLANDVTDLSKIKKLIQAQEPTDAEGNLQPAIKMLSPIVKQWSDYQMVGFTDENVELGDLTGEIVDLSTNYNNCAVDWVNHTENEQGGVTVQAKIENHGTEAVSHEINLYLGETLFDVQSVTLDAKSSQIVTFSEVGATQYQKLSKGAGYLWTEINEKDGLTEDNTAYEILDLVSEKRILLVSKQNQFLEKAMTLGEQVTLEKTTSVKNIDSDKEYDLIIYDGQMPKKWYGSENVLVLNPGKDLSIEGTEIIKYQKKRKNIRVTVPSGDLIAGMEEFDFGCSQAEELKLPSWGYSFCNNGTESVAYTGKLDGRNITVMGFDLHNTDLPLQMEFPILMQNILNQSGQSLGLANQVLSPLETADMICRKEVQQVTWISPDGAKTKSVPKDGHANYTGTKQTGLYQVSVKTDSDTVEQYFYVAFPSAESTVNQGITVVGQDGKKLEASGKADQVFGAVSFLKPILVLLLLVLLLEWIVYLRRKPVFPGKVSKWTTYALRLLVMALVLGALFGFSITKKNAKTTTIFLVDASDSFKGNQDTAVDQVKKALEKLPSGEQAGVVAFGGDTNIEQFVTEKVQFEGLDSMPMTSETNLEQAVQTALSLYPENSSKRMVLLTDGSENAGDLCQMSSSLMAAQVDVQVVKWDSTPEGEVFISDLTVPDSIAVGDHYNVEIQVESTIHTGAKLQLYNDNTLRREETVDLQKGTNQFSFQDVRDQKGFTNYRAVVIPDQDTVQMNNEYVAYTEASEKKPILLVEGKKGEASEFCKVLEATGYPYQVVEPSRAPSSVQKLNRYASVLLENVYIDDLASGFVDSIETYVKDYGGGLIAIGGDQSFALGGYRDTPLEKVLPVNMDHKEKEELPKLAMVMVIDHSSSMSETTGGKKKLKAAKEAAAGALKNLRDNDMVGVLEFDDSYNWIVKPQQLDDRDTINRKIMGIKEGGATSIFPALKAAYDAVKETDAQIKHVILLTDGQDGGGQNYDALLQHSEEDGITVSTVAVGKDADQNLLTKIAEMGSGRNYQTDGEELSRIFAQEIYLSQGDFLINRDFTPVITADSDVLDGLEDGFPELRGYIGTSVKDSATAVLMDDEKEDPILAEWRYGLGQTIAFTSDVTGEWTGNYVSWEDYPMLWSHLIEETIYDQDDSESKITTRQAGNTGIVRYENAGISGDAKVTAIYTDQSGEQQEITLDAVSSGVYEGNIPLGETGVYSINVRRSEGEELKEAANVQLTMQYSQEYLYTNDSNALDQFVSETGGRFISDLQEIYQEKPNDTVARTNLTLPFLLAAVCLWLLDIVNRRLPVLSDGIWLQKLRSRIDARRKVRREKRASRQEDKGQKKPQTMSAMEQTTGERSAGSLDAMPPKQSGREGKKAQKEAYKKRKNTEPELLDVSSLLQKQQERKR